MKKGRKILSFVKEAVTEILKSIFLQLAFCLNIYQWSCKFFPTKQTLPPHSLIHLFPHSLIHPLTIWQLGKNNFSNSASAMGSVGAEARELRSI